MHLPPDAKVGVELHPQVRVVDLWALRRCGFHDATARDLGQAPAPPEVGDEVAEKVGVADEDSHFAADTRPELPHGLVAASLHSWPRSSMRARPGRAGRGRLGAARALRSRRLVKTSQGDAAATPPRGRYG